MTSTLKPELVWMNVSNFGQDNSPCGAWFGALLVYYTTFFNCMLLFYFKYFWRILRLGPYTLSNDLITYWYIEAVFTCTEKCGWKMCLWQQRVVSCPHSRRSGSQIQLSEWVWVNSREGTWFTRLMKICGAAEEAASRFHLLGVTSVISALHKVWQSSRFLCKNEKYCGYYWELITKEAMAVVMVIFNTIFVTSSSPETGT